MSRRLLLLVPVLALQALLAATMFTPAPHSGGDNAGYVALGNALATGQGYVETWEPGAPAHTKYPPVFPALIALLIQLGVSTWAGFKSIAFVSALLVTGSTYLWASRRAGVPIGLGVALATGCSWSLLWHSSYILSDVPFLAFTMTALWGIDEVMARDGAKEGGAKESGAEEGGAKEGRSATPFLIAAGVGAFLAYFTRSAGLPLVVAILGGLLLHRHRRAAAVMAVAVGVPAAIWFVRGLTAGSNEGRYASEFLLRDPYDPGLGRADVGDFAARVSDNLVGYATEHLPRAFAGSGDGSAGFAAFLLIALALLGWGRAIQRERGPAELFLPLYVGLILVWPTVWSGDRFALPLLPLCFLYAAEAIGMLKRWIPEMGVHGARLALLVLLLVPMYGGWRTESSWVAECNQAVRTAGPWACSGPATAAFSIVATWAGENLEPGSAVLTRKPRIFHVLSGLPSRTYPFVDDPGALFEEAAAVGARHVVLDGIGTAGMRWVAPVVLGNRERFCQTIAVALGQPGQTILLGIVPEGAAPPPGSVPEGSIMECGEELAGGDGRLEGAPGPEIPLLTRGRR